MATTHYQCEVCGCIDLEERFFNEGIDECPDCHSFDVIPYRMFRCGIIHRVDQLALFPSAVCAPAPSKHPDDGCGYEAEQSTFFGSDLFSDPDFDPQVEGVTDDDFVCPHCQCTKYHQIPVTTIVRGDPEKIAQSKAEPSS